MKRSPKPEAPRSIPEARPSGSADVIGYPMCMLERGSKQCRAVLVLPEEIGKVGPAPHSMWCRVCGFVGLSIDTVLRLRAATGIERKVTEVAIVKRRSKTGAISLPEAWTLYALHLNEQADGEYFDSPGAHRPGVTWFRRLRKAGYVHPGWLPVLTDEGRALVSKLGGAVEFQHALPLAREAA